MTGVDLTRIDGVDAYTALKVISEIGTDMTKWPSAKHFASWLGLSPNNRITGGKVIVQDQAQRQPGRRSFAWRPRAAPLRQRPGRLPAPEESPPGSAQGHYRHGPQAAHLHHAAHGQEYVDAGRNTTRAVSARALRAASADATRVIILSPVFTRPGALPRSRRCWTSWGGPGSPEGSDQPGIGHQAVVVEGDADAVGMFAW